MIDFLFFVKPAVDMLWQYKALDAVMMLLLISFMLPRYFKIKLTFPSVALLLFFVFLLRAYLAHVNQDTTIIFIKISSAILIFFAAQFNKHIGKTFDFAARAFLIPVACILYLAMTKHGFIYWGDILTFVGPYYYKTDLAIAVIFSLIFFRKTLYFSKYRTLRFGTGVYIFAIAPYLIFLANSRMLLVVYAAIALMLIFESFKYGGYVLSLPLKVSVFFLSCLAFLAAIYVYNVQSNLQGNLAIDLSFSAANTQGRSGIWEAVLANFMSGHLFYILFGYSINADYNFDTYLQTDAHNTYLKLLVNTGVFGLGFYLVFVLGVMKKIRYTLKNIKLDKLNYYNVTTIYMIFTAFLLCGFTQSNILYTQSSWYAFYFAGLLYNAGLVVNRQPAIDQTTAPKSVLAIKQNPLHEGGVTMRKRTQYLLYISTGVAVGVVIPIVGMFF